MGVRIDLNCDLGEGLDDWVPGVEGPESRLLDVVTSANVACGFHAGDERVMGAVCRAAAERGVAVGAQVSYRDRAGFGRR
ncbi:LamB/YcsF family protein, partial [Cellulomonas septica]